MRLLARLSAARCTSRSVFLLVLASAGAASVAEGALPESCAAPPATLSPSRRLSPVIPAPSYKPRVTPAPNPRRQPQPPTAAHSSSSRVSPTLANPIAPARVSWIGWACARRSRVTLAGAYHTALKFRKSNGRLLSARCCVGCQERPLAHPLRFATSRTRDTNAPRKARAEGMS